MGVPRTGVGLAASLLVSSTFVALMATPGVARAQGPATAAPGIYRAYVGTYTNGDGAVRSRGIYVMDLDVRTGEMGSPRLAAASPDPSFLAIHPNREFLYAVNESGEILGRRDGGVSAFAINPTDGTLTLLNQQLPAGSGPCHLVVDRGGQNVLVANYGSGSVGCLPIERDGRLRAATSKIQHRGHGVDRSRQTTPHAHSINLDAANRFAFVADLGLDKVLIYHFDRAAGQLGTHEPPFDRVGPSSGPADSFVLIYDFDRAAGRFTAQQPRFAQVAHGSGPRHFAFHPDGRFAYVINEMANTVTAFAYNADDGRLKELQTISTLPADFRGRSNTAEVQVHPSGRFLYGSNRGHDSIAIFAIDPTTGRLTSLGFEPTRGKTPRNFAIDPTGAILLAENQDSDTIVAFRIRPETGQLEPTGQVAKVGKPVCIKMIPRPAAASR